VSFLGNKASAITCFKRKESGHGWKHIQDY
jgi:hypothetical protein